MCKNVCGWGSAPDLDSKRTAFPRPLNEIFLEGGRSRVKRGMRAGKKQSLGGERKGRMGW